ncbi:hypothetical protein SAMD00023353_3100160 [Rosellinia necatrix]|uniref:Uncharacterized protein n=1 Tax=Rosellinia necatrix TaxID=77044 RepID=A0A1S8A8I0_ROSNE|nr:hypothetical protein SAMD00023353_3100160 [Rosellinia necatrix]
MKTLPVPPATDGWTCAQNVDPLPSAESAVPIRYSNIAAGAASALMLRPGSACAGCEPEPQGRDLVVRRLRRIVDSNTCRMHQVLPLPSWLRRNEYVLNGARDLHISTPAHEAD